MFKKYEIEIKKILSVNTTAIDWSAVLINHQAMIIKIQHERLIHLLVTLFVGIIMSLSFLTTILSGNVVLLLVDFSLLPLFIGYLLHYRYLENTTQHWYILEDRIKEKT